MAPAKLQKIASGACSFLKAERKTAPVKFRAQFLRAVVHKCQPTHHFLTLQDSKMIAKRLFIKRSTSLFIASQKMECVGVFMVCVAIEMTVTAP